MSLVSIEMAVLITEQPLHRLMYAVGDNIIKHYKCNGVIIVDCEEIQEKAKNGVITRLSVMIKRSLKNKGVWEDSWEFGWESPEMPMTEDDYIEWLLEKKRVQKTDDSIGVQERIMWQEYGIRI